jgi:hypothetical protein
MPEVDPGNPGKLICPFSPGCLEHTFFVCHHCLFRFDVYFGNSKVPVFLAYPWLVPGFIGLPPTHLSACAVGAKRSPLEEKGQVFVHTGEGD